jgi:adenosine deaminase
MPKAEVHLHLDGSLRIDTALDLARSRGVDAPRDRAGMAAALIAPMPCADQAELLRAFDLPIALMQDAEAPERIAHGQSAIDDPALCAELIARGVTLDLCPTSNWQAGSVPSIAEHPLARLHRAGVSVTLSTDDTTVSDLSLSDEYVRAVEAIGLTVPELWAIDRRALDVAFADEAVLGPLRATFARHEAETPGPPDTRPH